MIHPCDKPCGNKTASGYCATTACINPQYSNIGTVQYGQGVQKRILTNYDLLREKSVEEMAEWRSNGQCPTDHFHGDYDCINRSCKDCWLDWLKQEAAE